MNFIRDIAIPVILILSVGAIIISVNGQLTNLLNLGGQNNILIVRDTQTTVENSTVPINLLEGKSITNIEKVVPLIYQTVPIIVKSNQTDIHTTIQFVAVNISELNSILPFTTIPTYQLNQMNQNQVIIGSQIVSDLQLDQNALENYTLYLPTTNSSLKFGFIDSVPDLFPNAIVLNIRNIGLINKTYNYQYYSELFISVRDRLKLAQTQSQIQTIITSDFPACNCIVLQGSGTNSLLQNVISKIVSQLKIFNFILDIIIVIRIIQSLFWIAQEYQYELNDLKILGASTSQIYVLFIFLGILMGNLGYLFGVVGSIFIPAFITYLLGIVTLQPGTIILPTFEQIFVNFIQINVLIVIVTLLPAFQLSRKKILRQKERE